MMQITPSYYRIMAGAKSVFAQEFLEGGFIAANWNIDQDLTQDLPDDWREFNHRFIPVYLNARPDKTKISAGLACGMLHTICKGIKQGDIILTPRGDGYYLVGKVISDYYYVPSGELSHRRKVEWFEQTLPRELMSQELKNSSGSAGAVCNLTKYAEELKTLIPDLDVNERAIDTWFERITEGLNDQQKADLKRKFARKGQLYTADDRIRLIALDIANHFVKNIDDGLKGQLACDSKASAIKYKKYLDEAGLFESAVVMSPPDSREGNTDVDESTTPEVTQWWKDNVGTQDEQAYTKQIIERFEKDDSLKLLIVVDKLLTGFDEPKNTVLYIDKNLKQHNLIQAIARVNRLHPKKKFGLLIDYRGILKELDSTILDYQDLAARTQGGYDINDISGLYTQMSTEYKRLPRLFKALWAIFADVKNKNDIEQLRQVLVPRIEERNGELVDIHLKVRDDFYEALTEFASCLKVALQSATFFEDKSFTDVDRQHYKETVKLFTSLRQLVKQDAGETIDYDEYADQVKKLLDKHVVGIEVKEPEGVYEVGKMGKIAQPEDWSEDKTRNETDIIKTRVTKMIEQELRDDPYAQEAFSKLLRQAIEDAEKEFEHPLKQYMLFREFEEKVEARRLDEIPDAFSGNKYAQAYYGVFKKILPEAFSTTDQQNQDKWIQLAFDVDSSVMSSVAENSINPQNIEADIRKKLLPQMFRECKTIGGGMDQAKKIVEMIVQITRVGLNGL